MLICWCQKLAKGEDEVRTYIVLVDIAVWDLEDLVLVDSDVDSLSKLIVARASFKSGGPLVRFLAVSVCCSVIECLHCERSQR